VRSVSNKNCALRSRARVYDGVRVRRSVYKGAWIFGGDDAAFYRITSISCHCCCKWPGPPLAERPDGTERYRKYSHIPSHLNLTQLEDFILQQYPDIPQLARVGFTFAKSTKHRKLIPVTGTCVEELRVELHRGQLFIIPKRDLLPAMVSCCFLVQMIGDWFYFHITDLSPVPLKKYSIMTLY